MKVKVIQHCRAYGYQRQSHDRRGAITILGVYDRSAKPCRHGVACIVGYLNRCRAKHLPSLGIAYDRRLKRTADPKRIAVPSIISMTAAT